jgi:hypothetical protein
VFSEKHKIFNWIATILISSFFIITALTPTKNCTLNTTLIAFTILFQAFSFFTLTTFLNLLMLYPQTEDVIYGYIVILYFLFKLKSMWHCVSVSSEGLYNCLLVFLFILLSISTSMTVAIFITIHLFLKAFTI